jgi:hypothetical protein
MARTRSEDTRTDADDRETIADGGTRREPMNPAKALLEDAAGL